MNEKKTYKADLEHKKINFFLVGSIVALSLSWFCLDLFASPIEEIVVFQDEAEAAKVDEYIPPETDQQEQTPQQQEEVQEKNVELILNMVDNDQKTVDLSDFFVDQTDDEFVVSDMEEDEGPIEDVAEVEPPVSFASQMPEFPGGMAALTEYLKKNTEYPSAAREARAQGVVAVQFVVEKDGSISGAKVLSPVFPALDEEALRVVKAMPKWKPGETNGKKLRVTYRVPITFSLQ